MAASDSSCGNNKGSMDDLVTIIDDIQKTENEINELNNKLLEKQQYLQLLRTKLLINTPCNENDSNIFDEDRIQNGYDSDGIGYDLSNLMDKVSNYFNEKLSILAVESAHEDVLPLCPHGMIMDWHTQPGVCDLCHTQCTEYYSCDGIRGWCCLCTNKVSKVAAYKIADHLCQKRQFEDFMCNYPGVQMDSTTQLKNKNSLDKTLEMLCNQMSSASLRLYGLLLFDIDNFKLVNDELGHQTGDELLKMIGAELRDMQLHPPKRYKNVWCYRDGGDEFAIIFRQKYEYTTENNEENVYGTDIYYELIQRIRIISLRMGHRITVSVGVTPPCCTLFETAKDWKTRTDKAMSIAKKSGKNTAQFYLNRLTWSLKDVMLIASTVSTHKSLQLSRLVRSLPCHGYIEFEQNTSFWYIKLSEEWQNTAAYIAQLCDAYTKGRHTTEYKQSLRLAKTWASLLNVHKPRIQCITPPSVAGLHISLGRYHRKQFTHGNKVMFKVTNVKVSQPFRQMPENIDGQHTSSDGLRYYPTLWILAEIEFVDFQFIPYSWAPHISLASVAVQLDVGQVEQLHRIMNGHSHASAASVASLHCWL
eukprot:105556_1